MSKKNPDRLSSTWLTPLHIEYQSNEFYRELMALDINSPSDQDALIERAIVPEFRACNKISRAAFMDVLNELADYPESDVRQVLRNAGPLTEPLRDYKAFFEKVRLRCNRL